VRASSQDEVRMFAQAGRDPKFVAFFQREYRETVERLVSADDERYQLLQGKARTLRDLLKLLQGDS